MWYTAVLRRDGGLTMHRFVCATVAALVMITSASAEMGEMGVGTSTCGEFAEHYRDSPSLWENVYFAWAQGFMTGMNLASAAFNDGANRDLSSIPLDQQRRFLRNYCNDHPLAIYEQGVLALLPTFKPGQPVRSK